MTLFNCSKSAGFSQQRTRPLFTGAAILSLALFVGCDVYVDDDDHAVPDIDVHEDGGTDVHVNPPDVDVHEGTDVDIHEAPDVDINEAPDVDVNEAPDVDVDVDGPDLNPPDVDIDTPNVDIDVDAQPEAEAGSTTGDQPE